MFIGFWQFKTTVSILLLTSCLGQELLQACDRDYCYERSIERDNIRENQLREWHRGERLYDDTERNSKFLQERTHNRGDVIKGDRENRVIISDFEPYRVNSRREGGEISHELDNLALNRRELREEENLSIRNEYRTMIDRNNVETDESRRSLSSKRGFLIADNRDNIDRRCEETRRIEHLNIRNQNSVENERTDRSRRLNERESQVTENKESRLLNDRLFETRRGLEQRKQCEVRRVSENKIRSDLLERDASRQPRSNERELLTENGRLVTNLAEEENNQRRDNKLERNQESRRAIVRDSERDHLPEERQSLERLSRREIKGFSEENDRRLELSERDEFRRLPLREPATFNRCERRLNERDQLTSNRQHTETISKVISRQERDNRLERNNESGRYNGQFTDTERLTKERENLRRLSERENRRSSERVSQLGQVNRLSENDRQFELLERDEFRRVPLIEPATLYRYESRSSERDQFPRNRRLFETTSSTDRYREERENMLERNHELRQSNDQFSKLERLPEEHESLRRFSEREGQRTDERLSQTDLEKETSTRIERENKRDYIADFALSNKADEFLRQGRRLNERDQLNKNRFIDETISKERDTQHRDNRLERNQKSRLSNDRSSDAERLLEERENLRQLSERINQRSSENLSQNLLENVSTRDTSRRNIERESLNLNHRLNKHIQRMSQHEMSQRENRYDIGRYRNEKEQISAVRQSGNTRQYLYSRERFSDQRELKDRHHDIISALNDRFERRNENLKERVDVLNRNAETRRLNSRQVMSEKEISNNRGAIQRNIREHDEEESKRIRETQDFLIDENISPRRSILLRESVERRYENVKELDERRGRKRDNNKENRGSRRLDERKFEDNEIVQRRIETHDTRTHNKRQNKNESRRTMESIVNQVIEVEQRSVKNKRESNFIRQDENLDHKYRRYMIDRYIEKPTITLNKGYVTLGQGALLAYIVMRTVNGKNDIKCNIYQKLQKAIALMGF